MAFILKAHSLSLVLWVLAVPIFCQFEQKATLYEGRGARGQYANFISVYDSNLRDNNFDNRAQSVCVIGAWIFYDTVNYNKQSKAAMEYIFGPGSGVCIDFKNLGGKTTSLRYAGSPKDYRADTLTLFEGVDFQAGEEYTPCDLSKLNSKYSASLIITGQNPWTVYDQTNYGGESICIYPPKSDDFTPAIIADLQSIGIPQNSIRSLRKGCWGGPKKYSQTNDLQSFGSFGVEKKIELENQPAVAKNETQ